jgi:hypothetical protein
MKKHFDRFANRWAPAIIIAGLAVSNGWLAYAAMSSFHEAAIKIRK